MKASGDGGLVCRIYKSRMPKSWETSRSEEETRKDSLPPQVPTDLDSDLWPLGGQDNKASIAFASRFVELCSQPRKPRHLLVFLLALTTTCHHTDTFCLLLPHPAWSVSLCGQGLMLMHLLQSLTWILFLQEGSTECLLRARFFCKCWGYSSEFGKYPLKLTV